MQGQKMSQYVDNFRAVFRVALVSLRIRIQATTIYFYLEFSNGVQSSIPLNKNMPRNIKRMVTAFLETGLTEKWSA
jgi:hypothetical protein